MDIAIHLHIQHDEFLKHDELFKHDEFFKKNCKICNETGHFAKMCRNKQKKEPEVHALEREYDSVKVMKSTLILDPLKSEVC